MTLSGEYIFCRRNYNLLYLLYHDISSDILLAQFSRVMMILAQRATALTPYRNTADAALEPRA